MFWQLLSRWCMRIPADRSHVDREIWWRTKKEKMDVATGRTWTSYELSCGAWHGRERILNEYWQIFVDDRPVPRDATDLQANVQPKAVFSYDMTVMEKICGWGEEEKWVGSLFAACMWVYTKCVLCDGQETKKHFLKRRMLSIMKSANWVCEEVLEEHEWGSPLTISLKEKEEEVLMELDYELDVLCVVLGDFFGLLLLQDWMDRQDSWIIKYHKLDNSNSDPDDKWCLPESLKAKSRF